MDMYHFHIAIIGAGSGGVAMAARLQKNRKLLKHFTPKIAIIDPSEIHYFQPFWTLVGAGLADPETTFKNTDSVIPKGITHIKKAVTQIVPDKNTLKLSDGSTCTYEYLIIATGLELDWGKISGLNGSLDHDGVCSIYQFEGAKKTQKLLSNFKQGTAIFTLPVMPIKCAGAPQKIMYLAEELFRKNKVRDKIQIIWGSNSAAMFGIPFFAEPLDKIAKQKGIITKFHHKLIEIDPKNKFAKFEVEENGAKTIDEIKYDLIHIVPPQKAPDLIKNSGLAWEDGTPQAGWLKCDQHTLQHLTYGNIFGIGDVLGVPNAKTAAGIRKQAPILEKNFISFLDGKKMTASYDGYASCPLIIDSKHVLLAEFGYDSKIMRTLPLDPKKPRYLYWLLKRYILPKIYWWGMLKGRM